MPSGRPRISVASPICAPILPTPLEEGVPFACTGRSRRILARGRGRAARFRGHARRHGHNACARTWSYALHYNATAPTSASPEASAGGHCVPADTRERQEASSAQPAAAKRVPQGAPREPRVGPWSPWPHPPIESIFAVFTLHCVRFPTILLCFSGNTFQNNR